MNNKYRSTLKSGSMMVGHYRYLDVFQIIESKQEPSNFNEYHLDIEYNQKYANIIHKNVDPNDKNAVFHENRMRERAHLDFLKELISLLSIVTNQYYEFDFSETMQVRPPDQETIVDFSDISSSLEITRDPSRVKQRQNYTYSHVSIHPSAEIFFNNYFRLNKEARERYNASIFLYQTMRKIILTSASMAIVGLISSIENLMDFENKKANKNPVKCNECKQPIYSISQRFKDFMGEFSEINTDDPNALLNKFYTRRSKISHAGRILEIDRLFSRFSLKEREEFTEIETHVRIALFNYLLNYNFSSEKTSK